MVNQKKAVKKAAAALLIFSTLTAGGVASSCYVLNDVRGFPAVMLMDSFSGTKVSDNSTTTRSQNNSKETPPYPGDSKENERWRKPA